MDEVSSQETLPQMGGKGCGMSRWRGRTWDNPRNRMISLRGDVGKSDGRGSHSSDRLVALIVRQVIFRS